MSAEKKGLGRGLSALFGDIEKKKSESNQIQKNKMHFMPIPADKNIENLEIYNSNNRYKDLFFALSHGVNFGGLRQNTKDDRNTRINQTSY